ncbi:hypothetical protein J1G35_02655 [Pseudomonas sp. SH10-3B]|uniref:hypothetical protein n=1 Tax=Pseudomonas sp. SH10-3B TaxID=2816049 RepID=UPI001CA747C6|nr:hypothetical protein [Pseudomonas sp. SH10-3B]MBY8944747.1 hypothetical protein [Pseudomonas sp. SH10-3B]
MRPVSSTLGSLPKQHDPGISIMNERLEITLQVAIDGAQELKLTFIFKPEYEELFHD